MTGVDLITKFESGAIPPEAFHHADHVQLAFEYLSRYPVLEALTRFCVALKSFAAEHGKVNLYHETITWAYLFLIHERIARAPGVQTWEEFSAGNRDLFIWKGGMLAMLYKPETLHSELARTTFILPDRAR
jgi:hypothetical protein